MFNLTIITMKMKNFNLGLLLAASLAFGACSNNEEIKVSEVTLGITLPALSEGTITLKSGTYTFTNISNGLETSVDYAGTQVTLPDGLYNVSFIGKADLTTTQTTEVNVQGIQQNVSVTGGTINLAITLHIRNANEQGNFVIAEVFSGGTIHPTTNKAYNGDQYIRIYNNSNQTLYADSLILLESEFVTTRKQDYTPNIMGEAMTVQAIAMIPGNGKQHPIAPGAYITLCDNATDHSIENSNSLNLSTADFEWYTGSTNANYPDIDNPAVPNLDMIYNYTKTIWVLTKQGNRAYAIGRLPKGVTPQNYLKDYTYDCHYTLANGNPTKEFKYYKFPNSWIIDAVNMSPKNSYVWNVVDASLDMGFTYINAMNSTIENAGKAVVRKVAYKEDNRDVLQDTNNSTVDFTPSVRATLLPKH